MDEAKIGIATPRLNTSYSPSHFKNQHDQVKSWPDESLKALDSIQ